jgi:hypothetical protein
MAAKLSSRAATSQNAKLDQAAKNSARVSMDEFVDLLNSPSRIAYLNFRAGFWRGAGITLGAAVVVVVIGFLVYILGGLPYIGDLLHQIDSAVKSTH